VSALAGVLFVVVFIYQLGILTPKNIVDGVSIDTPKPRILSSMPGALREDALMVGVQRDGKVLFRTDVVAPEQLPAAIRKALAQGAERKVYIRADVRANYGIVKEVLDAVRESGVEHIGFITEPRLSDLSAR
jgi:biopolymer transport protein ExbD/biopolymer transport protein TolR